MPALKHKSHEFTNSNPGWSARTASRLHASWQNWQSDATENNDELAQSIANDWRQSYLDFIAKHATDEAARAVAEEMATAFIETNRAAVVKIISTIAHKQLSYLLTAQVRATK